MLTPVITVAVSLDGGRDRVGACPRGDLNPHNGEISPDLDLNSKTGEKSPDRGVHAAMVAGKPRLASNAFR